MFLALKNGLGRLAVFFRGLFDEYGGAAAAYSLRRLGSAYSGPLVRVRRSSDDVEVNVAFDANGAVSASSAITNVTESPDQGDTTATTLGGFLTEAVTASYNAEDGTTSGWAVSDFGGSSTTISNVTSGALSGTRSFEIDITSGSTSTGYPRVRRSTSGDLALSAGLQYRFKCKLKLTSGSAKVFGRLGSASGNVAFVTQTLVVGQLVEIDNTFTAASIGGVVDNIEFVFDGTVGTGTILVDDIELTALNHNAHVQTWYDQSGSGNHATQNTSGDQPKIAEAGALLADGIDFDGVDDYLTTTSGIITLPSSTFVVQKQDSLSGTQYTWATQLSGINGGYMLRFGSANTEVIDAASPFPSIGLTAADNTDKHLIYVNAINGGKLSGAVDGGSIEQSAADITGWVAGNYATAIGARPDSPSLYFNGKIQEIIHYNTDQSANRSGIESNIADYYGITLP